MFIHGDGKHTRRYLYAGDAADAFDTILHKGVIGQVYNVGSVDEISNLELCSHLLKQFGYDHPEDLPKYVAHTTDRPFNDRRYAVDATRLKELGWEQKTSFEEGLRVTVNWYRMYGEEWWGDISTVLSPFPVVEGKRVEALTRNMLLGGGLKKTRKTIPIGLRRSELDLLEGSHRFIQYLFHVFFPFIFIVYFLPIYLSSFVIEEK